MVESHPWAALNIFKAFAEARKLTHRETYELAAVYFDLDRVPYDRKLVLDFDPYPYGVQANRGILEAMTGYSHEQCLTPRQVGLEEVFYPPTLDL